MLSPMDIKNKKFDLEKKKYYDAYQVDEFLDEIKKDYSSLTDENNELRKKIKTLSEGIQYYRSMESTLQSALLLAEKTAMETVDSAKLKGNQIEKDAQEKAKTIIAGADQEVLVLKTQYKEMIEKFNVFKSQCQQAAKAQLELLTGELFAAPSIKELDIEPEKEEIQSDVSSTDYVEPENYFYVPPVETPAETEEASSMEPEIEVADDLISPINVTNDLDISLSETPKQEEPVIRPRTTYTNVMDVKPIDVKTKPVSSYDSLKANQSDKKLNSLLNDLNMNSTKKNNDSDPFEFLGSIDKF